MNYLKEHFIEILTITLAIFSLIISIISLSYSKNSNDNMDIENRPSIRIVQNLWNDTPSFSLVNEGAAKLDKIPYPTYFMYIPSKVMWYFNDGKSFSNLVLSPISYTTILNQKYNIEGTKSSLSYSELPHNFKSKFGERDMIRGKVKKLSEEISVQVVTYPFLVIVSPIDYEYRGKLYEEVLLSTPIKSEKISRNELSSLIEYTSDNAEMEINYKEALKRNINVYEFTNQKVEKKFSDMKNGNDSEFLGGKEGGYSSILKIINKNISPVDPIKEYLNNKGKK